MAAHCDVGVSASAMQRLVLDDIPERSDPFLLRKEDTDVDYA
jgi:hypothetical protein